MKYINAKAMHFERVCGNKGYSYDAHQANVRFNNSLAGHVVYQANDIIYKGKGKHWNRYVLFLPEIFL